MSNKCKRCGIAGGSHVHCANELWAERDKFKALLCDDDDENAVTCDTCHLNFQWDPDTERPASVCQWCYEKEQLEAERDQLRERVAELEGLHELDRGSRDKTEGYILDLELQRDRFRKRVDDLTEGLRQRSTESGPVMSESIEVDGLVYGPMMIRSLRDQLAAKSAQVAAWREAAEAQRGLVRQPAPTIHERLAVSELFLVARALVAEASEKKS